MLIRRPTTRARGRNPSSMGQSMSPPVPIIEYDVSGVFTRATAATWYNPFTDHLQRFGVDELRYVQIQSTLGPVWGAVIEGPSTNIVPQCSNLAVSPWTTIAGGTAVQDATGPDGEDNSASRVISSGTQGSGRVQGLATALPDNSAATFSVMLKQGAGWLPGTLCRLVYRTNSGTNLINDFPITDEWERYIWPIPDIGAGANTPAVWVEMLNSDPGTEMLVFGVQVENMGFASQLIETTTTVESRNADLLTIDGTPLNSQPFQYGIVHDMDSEHTFDPLMMHFFQEGTRYYRWAGSTPDPVIFQVQDNNALVQQPFNNLTWGAESKCILRVDPLSGDCEASGFLTGDGEFEGVPIVSALGTNTQVGSNGNSSSQHIWGWISNPIEWSGPSPKLPTAFSAGYDVGFE